MQPAFTLIDEREARRRLGISRPTIYRLRRDGLVPFVLIGGSVRYRSDVIERLAREGVRRGAK